MSFLYYVCYYLVNPQELSEILYNLLVKKEHVRYDAVKFRACMYR